MSDIDRADLRLHILLCLNRDHQPAVTANQEQLIAGVPLAVSRTAMRVELAWLEQAGAIVTRAPGGVMIATLTGEGLEHLQARALIPDIRPPTPAEMVR